MHQTKLKSKTPLTAKKALKANPKPKKQKAPTITKLKKEADKQYSLYVRLRDSINGVCACITCGVKKPVKAMQNGHFVKRSVNLLRYDEENCNAQCYQCNVRRYGEQYLYAKALDDKYGEGTAEKLMAQKDERHQFNPEELTQIIEDSKKQIAFLES